MGGNMRMGGQMMGCGGGGGGQMLGNGLMINAQGIVVKADGSGGMMGGMGCGGMQMGGRTFVGQASGTTGEVWMASPDQAQMAAKGFNGSKLNGASIIVMLNHGSPDGTKLLVNGLALGTTWQQLRDHFGAAGQVALAKVVPPRRLGSRAAAAEPEVLLGQQIQPGGAQPSAARAPQVVPPRWAPQEEAIRKRRGEEEAREPSEPQVVPARPSQKTQQQQQPREPQRVATAWPSWQDVVAASTSQEAPSEACRQEAAAAPAAIEPQACRQAEVTSAADTSEATPLAETVWQRFQSDGDQGCWWWHEATSAWFMEADPGCWSKYIDPGNSKMYWWKEDGEWFWVQSGSTHL